MNNLYEYCPSFLHCRVPRCPLDPLKKERDYLKGDKKCPKTKKELKCVQMPKVEKIIDISTLDTTSYS